MKKSNIGLIVLSMLMLSSCTGWESTSSVSSSITLQDVNGRQVEVIPGSYRNVVCIGAGALRMYSYVGDVSLLSGVEDIDNTSLSNRPKMFDGVARPYLIAHEEEFRKLPSCGVGGPLSQAAEPEKILACHPDIIVSEYEDVDKANALSKQVGVPVITLSFGSKGVFDDKTKDSFVLLGRVFDKEDRAKELLDYIDSCKSEIQEKTKDITEKPKAYIGGLGNWGTTDHLMTSNAYPCFNVANITNIASDAGLTQMGVQKLEEEKFESLSKDIDVMILDSAAMKNIIPKYQENPSMFDNVKAWKNGEVYLQLAYNAYYTNMELMLANTYFDAKAVYPSAFASLDMNAKLTEITTKFLGSDLTEKINAYHYSYGGYQKIDTTDFLSRYTK